MHHFPSLAWRQRMHPRQSKMELDVLADLNHHHLFPSTTKSFCVVSTEPDFYFPQRKKAIYLDGRYVHRNRQDKDSWLRDKLEQRHGVKVLSITYDRPTKKKRREIVAEILAFLEEQK